MHVNEFKQWLAQRFGGLTIAKVLDDAGLQVANYTTYRIHHAAILTLVTIPVAVLLPVVSELPVALLITFSSNIVETYTNLDSPYLVVSPSGMEDATEQADTSSGSGNALLTASTKIKAHMIHGISSNIATHGGLGLSVLLNNNISGDVTGGHVDNTIDVKVWYLKAT